MADSRSIVDKVREASESEGLAKILRRNPDIARRAEGDREGVALVFHRATKQYGIGTIPVIEAVYRGYIPRPFSEPFVQPPPAPPEEPPVAFNATCDDVINFELAQGENGIPFAFTFGDVYGNAMSVEIDLTMLGPGFDLRVELDGLTANCQLFLLKPGFSEYNATPANYFTDPGEDPGTANESWTIPWATLSTYAEQRFHVVVYHKSDFPLVNGTFRVFCEAAELTIISVTPNGVEDPVVTALAISGVPFLGVDAVKVDGIDVISFNVISDILIEAQVSLLGGLHILTVHKGIEDSNNFNLLSVQPNDETINRGAEQILFVPEDDQILMTTSQVLVNGIVTTFVTEMITVFGSDFYILRFIIPPQTTPGMADIAVTITEGTFSFPDLFQVLANPYIASIDPPTIVPTATNFTLNIFGDHFLSVTSVDVDGVSVPFSIIDDGFIQATVDGSTLEDGPNPVKVTNPIGDSNIVQITVAPGVQTPITVVPNTGPTTGGTHIVIEVVDSTGCISASVGGVDLTGFAIDDATHVSGDTPAHGIEEQVDVSVVNPYGTGTLLNGFTYLDAVILTTEGGEYLLTEGGEPLTTES